MSKPRCVWETVMPGQMERISCRCRRGGPVVAKAVIQQHAFRQGQWKFTNASYWLPQGGGNEESYIYLNPWQVEGQARRDAEETALRAASAVCRRRR